MDVSLPRYTGLIPDFESAKDGYHKFAVDPSRGSILSLLIQAPSLGERIDQGGVVGYVIIALLILGLLIVAERMVTLTAENSKVKKQ